MMEEGGLGSNWRRELPDSRTHFWTLWGATEWSKRKVYILTQEDDNKLCTNTVHVYMGEMDCYFSFFLLSACLSVYLCHKHTHLKGTSASVFILLHSHSAMRVECVDGFIASSSPSPFLPPSSSLDDQSLESESS